MSIKIKRIILALTLLLASVWNCSCLLELIPFTKWPFSLSIVSVVSLIVLIPLLFPAFFKVGERSRYHKELTKIEKLFAGITISLLALWAVTVIACLVYPL